MQRAASSSILTEDLSYPQQWKIDAFEPPEKHLPFTEESSFATLFPKYRETYLREVWGAVTQVLEKHVRPHISLLST